MSRSNSWTPRPYPLQSSPPPVSPATHEPTSQSANEAPRLPRNIRALKNGKSGELTGRTIIVCLDGTGDKFDSDNSNIVHFVSCLKKSNPTQITYYQSGIGTYGSNGLSKGFKAGVDMAVGSGLGVHIRDAYRFLMQNYQENDRICIFGFSRGAYTARCLSGMVHKVGLLPAHNVEQVAFAYQYYKDDTQSGWNMSIDFKRTFCMDVSVHFIGVFDSVASVGFIPRTLPLSSTPLNKARYFRHAMALDEHRAKFKICRFQRKDHIGASSQWETIAVINDETNEPEETNAQARKSGSLPDTMTTSEKSSATKNGGVGPQDLLLTPKQLQEHAVETDVLEVWFAGCHADVGGGAVKNEERHKLSQIPLRWMLRQCFECNTGIIFKSHRLAEEGLDVHTLWPTYTRLEKSSIPPPPSLVNKFREGKITPISQRSTVLKPIDEKDTQGLHHVKIWRDEPFSKQMHDSWVPEQVEDYFDAASPMHDQLVCAKAWWILEFWPVKINFQQAHSEKWIEKTGMNKGRYRGVEDTDPNIHWSVKQRIDENKYEPRVRLARGASWNIVV